MKDPSKHKQTTVEPANDNGSDKPKKATQVFTDIPTAILPLPGEAELVARFLASVLANPANDNEPPEEP